MLSFGVRRTQAGTCPSLFYRFSHHCEWLLLMNRVRSPCYLQLYGFPLFLFLCTYLICPSLSHTSSLTLDTLLMSKGLM